MSTTTGEPSTCDHNFQSQLFFVTPSRSIRRSIRMGRLRGPRGVDTSLRGPLHARVEGVVVLVAPPTSPGYPNHVRFAISEIVTGAIRRTRNLNSGPQNRSAPCPFPSRRLGLSGNLRFPDTPPRHNPPSSGCIDYLHFSSSTEPCELTESNHTNRWLRAWTITPMS